MRDAEVIVVGGSLGGTAVAAQLQQRGHEVLVVERAPFPREKVCGEGLMPYGVGELVRLGVRDVADEVGAQPFLGIGYQVGSIHAKGHFPRGFVGLGVRRSRFDAALAARLPLVRHQARVATVKGRPGAMEVHTREGVLRCSAVVGADGMRSTVRSALGLDRARRGRPRYGLRGHLRLPKGVRQIERVEVLVASGLELYLTPVGPREINVAVLLEKDRTSDLKGDLAGGFRRLFEPELPWLAGAETLSEPALTGPLRNEALAVATDGAVLVGDAAGFLDGITGEGMSLTLLGARLAAEELSGALREGDLSAGRLLRYGKRRTRASQDLTWLTEIVLAGIRQRWLARRFVGGLARHPEVFDRVLAVNAGVGRLTDVGVGGLWKVLRRGADAT